MDPQHRFHDGFLPFPSLVNKAAKMSCNPLNLPEIVENVLTWSKADFDPILTEHSDIQEAPFENLCSPPRFISRLIRLSTISSTWARETRPFLFNSITIVFGPPRMNPETEMPMPLPETYRALERTCHLIALIRRKPVIATWVKHLNLCSDTAHANPPPEWVLHSTEELNACADSLTHLRLSGAFEGLISVRIAWDGHLWGRSYGGWWKRQLTDESRSVLAYLLSRPTLQTVILKAKIPLSLWAPSTSASALHLNGAAYDPSSSIAPIESWTFRNLSHLNFIEFAFEIEEIRSVVSHARNTLVSLKCYIICGGAAGTEQDLDFSDLPFLREFYLRAIAPESQTEAGCIFALGVMHHLPWAQLVQVGFEMIVVCPPLDTEHTVFEYKGYWEEMDLLIYPYAHKLRMSMMSDVYLGMDLELCESCEASLDTADPYSTLSRLIWCRDYDDLKLSLSFKKSRQL